MTDKDPAAVALGKRRAASLTADHQAAAGRALQAGLSSEERRRRAKLGAATRKRNKATHKRTNI